MATIPVGPHRYRIVKEPEPLKSMIGLPPIIERPRLRAIFIHADPVAKGIGPERVRAGGYP